MAEMRLEVLLEAARSGEAVAAVCKRYGISRQTFYVYRRRFEAEGIDGLEPRSRQPVNQPQRMPAAVEELVCRMRKEHPKWGARRIRAELRRKGMDPPAVSSIHRALVRNNLVALRPSRPRPATRRFEWASPNDLWQIDFSCLFLADDQKVWEMDILDDHARFLLALRVVDGPTGQAAWECFEWAVARYGLPAQVLSDNGTCFTGRLIGARVEFERRLEVLGVRLINSRPYHPQTLGKLERFHRTLKEWLDDHPRAETTDELQALLDEFRVHYNEDRPHQGIDDALPIERYQHDAPREQASLPGPLPEAPHPSGAILRRVNCNGTLGYRGFAIHVGGAWKDLQLRITEIDGVVHCFYGDQLVRALVIDPDRQYQPLGQRHISRGWSKRKGTAKG
ncbi:MAG TPA: IS481 family transposase [Acidimicrobiales bacterium]|nr:IS481 family transposase [Acidimicrobiales bacterium]